MRYLTLGDVDKRGSTGVRAVIQAALYVGDELGTQPDGIFWIARTGAPWRDLPEEFGKWSSVYRQFRRWTLAGLWEDILDALNHAGIAPDKLQMIDSTVIRAHHHAAGAKGGLRKRLLAVREVASRPRSISASTALASR